MASLTIALLPAMLDRGWGRIVNVSSGAAADPAGMIRANAYVTGKAALEGHTLNLAAELADTGVTANVYRPGIVDTADAGVDARPGPGPGRRGPARAVQPVPTTAGSLITPEESAASLLARLPSDATAQIWLASRTRL